MQKIINTTIAGLKSIEIRTSRILKLVKNFMNLLSVFLLRKYCYFLS